MKKYILWLLCALFIAAPIFSILHPQPAQAKISTCGGNLKCVTAQQLGGTVTLKYVNLVDLQLDVQIPDPVTVDGKQYTGLNCKECHLRLTSTRGNDL
jgi:hypothetical protein